MISLLKSHRAIVVVGIASICLLSACAFFTSMLTPSLHLDESSSTPHLSSPRESGSSSFSIVPLTPVASQYEIGENLAVTWEIQSPSLSSLTYSLYFNQNPLLTNQSFVVPTENEGIPHTDPRHITAHIPVDLQQVGLNVMDLMLFDGESPIGAHRYELRFVDNVIPVITDVNIGTNKITWTPSNSQWKDIIRIPLRRN